MFPNVREFFSKAEVERQAPSPSSREEEVRSREERLAVDEDLLNAHELSLSRQHEELQQRIRTLEAQKKTFLEAEELLQARAALNEKCLEQGMLNVEGWTRIEVEAATEKTI